MSVCVCVKLRWDMLSWETLNKPWSECDLIVSGVTPLSSAVVDGDPPGAMLTKWSGRSAPLPDTPVKNCLSSGPTKCLCPGIMRTTCPGCVSFHVDYTNLSRTFTSLLLHFYINKSLFILFFLLVILVLLQYLLVYFELALVFRFSGFIWI